MNTVNLEQVKITLYNLLKPSGWADVLKTFILSNDFDIILNELLKQSQDGRRFTPVIKNLFRAFEECPYNSTNVVLFGQDPYPYANVADGIAFSCSIDNHVQPSLRYIHEEIARTVYPSDIYNKQTDLKYLSNQGILMLNSALTTTISKIGTHYKLWQPFISFLLDTITFNKPNLLYVFLGKKAQEWSHSVPDNNYKILESHPAQAAHNKAEMWDSNNMFNRINEILVKQGKATIVW